MKLSPQINEWYMNALAQLEYPIYSSYDVRSSGYKIAPVDANIYPAGFNNIHEVDHQKTSEAFDHYIKNHFGQIERILLVTEEHTLNKFYWNNIAILKARIEATGRKLLVSFPKLEMPDLTLDSASFGSVDVVAGSPEHPMVKSFAPQLIVSNNDFSNPLTEWAQAWNLPITPPRELGWYQRQKSKYFELYNGMAEQFSKLAGLDPFLMQVQTELFESFDVESEASQQELALQVGKMIDHLSARYKELKIPHAPVIFIKNNAGTYGLAVTQVQSADEVLAWGYKHRKRMKAAKGGRKVTQLILQEGIPSQLTHNQAPAEAVVYMVGCQVVGHFLRYHAERTQNESLNAPGSAYQSLPSTEIEHSPAGWSARLGLLALGLEAQAMGVTFKDFKKSHCKADESFSAQ